MFDLNLCAVGSGHILSLVSLADLHNKGCAHEGSLGKDYSGFRAVKGQVYLYMINHSLTSIFTPCNSGLRWGGLGDNVGSGVLPAGSVESWEITLL